MQLVNPFTPSNSNIPALDRMAVFTSSGTFTAQKTGDHLVYLRGGGGGGGGGGTTSATVGDSASAGQGGTAGEDLFAVVSLVAGTDYPVVIGAGGAGAARAAAGGANGSNGTSGGDSTFNGLTAAKGQGGYGGCWNSGGTAHFGEVASNGGGFGGGYGGQPYPNNVVNDGVAATGYGSGGGGGGGMCAGGGGRSGGGGGNGAPGIMVIVW